MRQRGIIGAECIAATEDKATARHGVLPASALEGPAAFVADDVQRDHSPITEGVPTT